MATIEAIEKELDLKVKSLKKLVVLIDGQEKLVKGLEKQEKALKPDAEKSKDKKVKDNYKQAQKEVVDAEKRLDDLTTSQQSATEVIAKLNSRLRWITEFVEARKGFLPWWDKEEAKMATLVDKTRDLAQDAEEASKSAQAAVSSGDFAGAREAGQDAGKAAREAAAKAEAAEKLYDGWGGTWTEQRNLKSSHMPKEDPASYADLTKKAYDVFKVGQNLMAAARRWGGEAARSAETAGQIAESGGDLLAMYGTILKSALQNLQAEATEIEEMVERKWGKVITERGKQFTEMRQTFMKNPEGMGAAARKMVEQSESLVPAQMEVLKKAVATLEQQQEKVISRIPKLRLLVKQSQGINDQVVTAERLVAGARKIRAASEANFDVAMGELDKLRKAVDA